MPIECPICDKVLQDARGLFGHLRIGHELQGDELYETHETAKQEGKVASPEQVEDLRRSLQEIELDEIGLEQRDGAARLMSLLDAYRTVQGRMEAVQAAPHEAESDEARVEDAAEQVADRLKRRRQEIAGIICEVLGGSDQRRPEGESDDIPWYEREIF